MHTQLFSLDLSDPESLVQAANDLTAEDEHRLTDVSEITAVIDAALPGLSDKIARKLMILRSQMEAQQLGTARIHLRVNAAQVRTVLARDLGLETEDRLLGRVALSELAQKARRSKPKAVNFADLFREQSTAWRQFMLCAQILKHIDAYRSSGSDRREREPRHRDGRALSRLAMASLISRHIAPVRNA